MKRFLPFLALLVVLILGMGVWIRLRSAGISPLMVRGVGRTAATTTPSSYVLQITNQSLRPYAYKIEVQSLVDTNWAHTVFSGPERQNANLSGWLAGRSQSTVQVAAPNSGVRFSVYYERVPTRGENWASWAFTWAGIKYPFSPRGRELTVYPEK